MPTTDTLTPGDPVKRYDLKKVPLAALRRELERRRLVSESFAYRDPRAKSGLRLISFAEDFFELPVGSLAGPRRTQYLADCRGVAMAYIKLRLKLSLVETGRLFNRDHSTVCAAMQRTERRPKLKEAFRRLHVAWSLHQSKPAPSPAPAP